MSADQRRRASPGRTIAILGMLTAFAPLATDMYLPAFDLMAHSFGISEGGVEITLSIFFLGLAIGQAIYGPLIDRFGRRAPLFFGIGLYLATTLLCLLVREIRVFTVLRFLQAVGGSAGMIVGRAIVSDLFDAQETARAMSLLTVAMMLAPIAAPILGGIILVHFGWEMIFVFMLAYALLCAVLVWLFIPETFPIERRSRHTFMGAMGAWRKLLARRDFLLSAIVNGSAQASIFAFITGSPFVFINLHGAGAQAYGWLFGLITVGVIAFAEINRFALRHRTPRRLLGLGISLSAAAAVCLVLVVSTRSFPGLLLSLWFAIGPLGLIGANSTAIAMKATGRHAGTGSSLIGVLQFGGAFVVSSLVAGTQNSTAYPMTLAILSCSLVAALFWFAGNWAPARASNNDKDLTLGQ
jgi:DHA1 family bicyclomycin/chloramphenicol resistance-like MFS transporter